MFVRGDGSKTLVGTMTRHQAKATANRAPCGTSNYITLNGGDFCRHVDYGASQSRLQDVQEGGHQFKQFRNGHLYLLPF